MRTTIPARLDVIQDTKSLDVTEDTLFTWTDGTRFTLMIADGAPQRLKTTGSLKPLLSTYGPDTAPGRYAALLSRDVTTEWVTRSEASPSDIALAVNAKLRESLEQVYGELSAEAVLRKEPTLEALRHDARALRWILPVCCYTIAQVDLVAGNVHYGHAGDTAIFALYKDGHTEQITPDQMAQHDDKMRYRIREVMQSQPINSREDLRPFLDEIWTLNQYNGLYHNYEDENGQPDPEVGVGVINGLPQLADYLVSGTLQIDTLEAIIVATDGFFWPAPLDESSEQSADRLNRMGQMIRQYGLKAYMAALRTEELTDSDGHKYQRFGSHDDATAIMLAFDVRYPFTRR